MKRWEYKTFNVVRYRHALADLGREGWELVSVVALPRTVLGFSIATSVWAFMRRELEQAESDQPKPEF